MYGKLPSAVKTIAPELLKNNKFDQDKDLNLLNVVVSMMEEYRIKETANVEEVKISRQLVIDKFVLDTDCAFVNDRPVALQRLVINAFFRRLIAFLPSSLTTNAYKILKEHHTTTTSQWISDVREHLLPVLAHVK